jgi:hypothetical protein
MTMMPSAHPDPELLAALAGADPEAQSDHQLVTHVTSCATCGSQVRDMSALRTALAELPDLVPSRPLQLVPPVPEPAPSTGAGWRITFRRAFAPLAVAGMVLLLIGGVGATGALGPAGPPALFPDLARFSVGGDAAAEPDSTDTDGEAPPESGRVGALSPSASPATEVGAAAPADEETSRQGEESPLDDRGGWMLVGVLGIGVLALALVLRRSGAPSAPPKG